MKDVNMIAAKFLEYAKGNGCLEGRGVEKEKHRCVHNIANRIEIMDIIFCNDARCSFLSSVLQIIISNLLISQANKKQNVKGCVAQLRSEKYIHYISYQIIVKNLPIQVVYITQYAEKAIIKNHYKQFFKI